MSGRGLGRPHEAGVGRWLLKGWGEGASTKTLGRWFFLMNESAGLILQPSWMCSTTNGHAWHTPMYCESVSASSLVRPGI